MANRALSGLKRIANGFLRLVGQELRSVARTRARPGATAVAEGSFILTDLITGMLRRRNERFVVLDGGAREALSDKRWTGPNAAQFTLYGFEVDPDQCQRLNQTAQDRGLDFHYYPVGLWSRKGRVKFHHTREPGGASFYAPNEAFNGRWTYWDQGLLGDLLSVTKVSEMDVTTVDSWRSETAASEIDFIKLNVQGAELEILKGARSSLDGVVGLQVEMCFNPTYCDAPLFSEVDAYLREKGFAFFDFLAPNFVGSAASPVKVTIPQVVGVSRWPSRRLFEGHFLYLRDPIVREHRGPGAVVLSPVKIIKLAAFAEMWGQVEYAFEVLAWLARRLEDGGSREEAAEVRRLLRAAASEYRSSYGDAVSSKNVGNRS